MQDLLEIRQKGGDTALWSAICELFPNAAEPLLGRLEMAVDKSLLTLPRPVIPQGKGSNNKAGMILDPLYSTGTLKGTGYLSIFPVDQGVEHGGGASFARNPSYFDPKNLVSLAADGGCNAIASTFGVLRSTFKWANQKNLPMIVKLNHGDLLNSPKPDQIMWASVNQAHDIGAKGVGLTIYYGSGEDARRQITEAQAVVEAAHSLGMFVVIWAYLRNKDFARTVDDRKVNFEVAADLTGEAVHEAANLGADIIKQKLPEHAVSGMKTLDIGKFDEDAVKLIGTHQFDWARWQVLNAFAGRVPLINSGGDSGSNDLAAVVQAAIINKRAGGSGLITGRKAFKRPTDEGIAILHAVQAVYLCDLIQPV